MTWLWRICFSLTFFCVCDAAIVSGSVKLKASKDKRVQSKRDYAGVVVWLESASNRTPHLVPKTARIVQKGKTFSPHVLAIPVSSIVEFPNFDPIFHNAFSNFSGQVFDVGLYPPGSSRSVKFRREGIVRVFCNIHPHMSAVIAVLNTPWYAVSDSGGQFRIEGVPPGAYTLHVFHERATEANLAAAEQKLTIPGDVTLPEFDISEAGYIATPHKNKYGTDYPPVIEDRVTYGGAAR